MSDPRETFVLVPGAGGEAWYWHRVAARLRDRGHEVLAVDLPAADPDCGLAEYADVVVGAADGRDDVVVVAQSMGAFVAPLACERADVQLMLLVAPMIPAAGESPGGWWEASGQIVAMRDQDLREGRDPDAEFDVRTMFFHDVPADVVAEAFSRGEPRQSDTPFDQAWPLATWPDVPTAVVAGRRDRLLPLWFLRRLARERLGVEPAVVDAGHLPALSRPDDLARWIERASGPYGVRGAYL